jgi:alkanesulfonate monooxygenase SsuD/methylene tetrahydromethanopterin reductase-like flavin-dependent oxidoreductase (luciferase family)
MARTNNPLEFGITIGGRGFESAVALTKAAEEAGFTWASFSDRPPESSLEGWTEATAVGAVTKKIIITHSTLNVPFRNPALLAKMAASLEKIIGEGRVRLTLGAGGVAQPHHYTSYGIPFGEPAERFAGVREAVIIMRGLWANETFSYEGKVYSVADANIGVRPASGSIPVWIGARMPGMMKYTGKSGDGWIKNGGWPASIDELQGYIRLLEEGAQAVGRDPLEVRRMLNGSAFIGEVKTDDPQPPNLGGSPAQILEKIEEYRNEGVDAFQVRFPEDVLLEQVQRFGEDIVAKAM